MAVIDTDPQIKARASQLPGYDEKYFLEGPRSRAKEFFFSFKVLLEFIRGFRIFHFK
jgi:hypothetical protein